MEKHKKGRRRFGAMLVTITVFSVFGLLFGWAAYAQGEAPTDSKAVDADVKNVTNSVPNASPLTQPPIPVPGQPPAVVNITDKAITFMEELSENVLSFINSSAQNTFYGAEKGNTDAATAMVTQHLRFYAVGPQEACADTCPPDSLLENGDIKISSVLFGTAYDGPRAQAAKDFLTNLFVPPSAPLVANFTADLANVQGGTIAIDTITKDSTLLAKYAQALSDEATLSAARQSFAEMMARRTVSSSDAGSISEMQVMETEAIKRFMNAGWVQKIQNATTPLQVEQEMAAMQAYQNWMAYQQFRQLERVEALLATLIVQNARSSQAFASNIPSAPPLNSPTITGGGPGSSSQYTLPENKK